MGITLMTWIESMSGADVTMQEQVWDADDREEIISEIDVERSVIVDFNKKRTEIQEGCCFSLTDCCNPWRWTDMENRYNAIHLAVTAHHVLYIEQKHSVHQANPCPPCSCCCAGNYQEDFAPKMRKGIPLEKITDIEIADAGSNELVTPAPFCCSCKFTPESVEIPFSKASVNTAGGLGVELTIEGIKDPKAFRKLVMDQKRGVSHVAGDHKVSLDSIAPGQMSMAQNSSEVTSLLQDIADSNRQILEVLRSK